MITYWWPPSYALPESAAVVGLLAVGIVAFAVFPWRRKNWPQLARPTPGQPVSG
ncbi:hypothetical protein ACIBSW_17525 [Actinoplanes sp. NPDC049668]|uniref:hypothetical protein n=1 Tax=unclassified Actinoplanes TaxID=2626549 RepID=UPI00339F8D03